MLNLFNFRQMDQILNGRGRQTAARKELICGPQALFLFFESNTVRDNVNVNPPDKTFLSHYFSKIM